MVGTDHARAYSHPQVEKHIGSKCRVSKDFQHHQQCENKVTM
jgi:hypothetical protein